MQEVSIGMLRTESVLEYPPVLVENRNVELVERSLDHPYCLWPFSGIGVDKMSFAWRIWRGVVVCGFVASGLLELFSPALSVVEADASHHAVPNLALESSAPVVSAGTLTTLGSNGMFLYTGSSKGSQGLRYYLVDIRSIQGWRPSLAGLVPGNNTVTRIVRLPKGVVSHSVRAYVISGDGQTLKQVPMGYKVTRSDVSFLKLTASIGIRSNLLTFTPRGTDSFSPVANCSGSPPGNLQGSIFASLLTRSHGVRLVGIGADACVYARIPPYNGEYLLSMRVRSISGQGGFWCVYSNTTQGCIASGGLDGASRWVTVRSVIDGSNGSDSLYLYSGPGGTVSAGSEFSQVSIRQIIPPGYRLLEFSVR